MAIYRIEGKKPLAGEVRIQGSKNAALPMIAAALLQKETVRLENCPKISDVSDMEEILRLTGAKTWWEKDTLCLECSQVESRRIPAELAGRLRSSILLTGALLGRCGYGQTALPGGCAIGRRPVDLHADAFRALGASVLESGEELLATADRLKGSRIHFRKCSVGATENAILAAVCAEGTSLLTGCARDPEIWWLCRFLRRMGARIEGEMTGQIRIQGGQELHGTAFRVPPDRIAAGTWLLLAAAVRGKFVLREVPKEEIGAVLQVYEKMGGQYRLNGDTLTADARLVGSGIGYIETESYPGFPTDLQSPFLAAAVTMRGNSTIRETVFENRFAAVRELKKMGAKIRQEGNLLYAEESRLRGADVCAGDLRAGAALVIAALAAEGTTTICRTELLERGYEDFAGELKRAGAKVQVISADGKERPLQ